MLRYRRLIALSAVISIFWDFMIKPRSFTLMLTVRTAASATRVNSIAHCHRPLALSQFFGGYA
jgi:hypothetical protein